MFDKALNTSLFTITAGLTNLAALLIRIKITAMKTFFRAALGLASREFPFEFFKTAFPQKSSGRQMLYFC